MQIFLAISSHSSAGFISVTTWPSTAWIKAYCGPNQDTFKGCVAFAERIDMSTTFFLQVFVDTLNSIFCVIFLVFEKLRQQSLLSAWSLSKNVSLNPA